MTDELYKRAYSCSGPKGGKKTVKSVYVQRMHFGHGKITLLVCSLLLNAHLGHAVVATGFRYGCRTLVA